MSDTLPVCFVADLKSCCFLVHHREAMKRQRIKTMRRRKRKERMVENQKERMWHNW